MPITASRLREDIYRILDSVLATGEPVEIERKGRVLRIVTDAPRVSRIARMKKRPGMVAGDPADLAEIDWSGSWNPDAAR